MINLIILFIFLWILSKILEKVFKAEEGHREGIVIRKFPSVRSEKVKEQTPKVKIEPKRERLEGSITKITQPPEKKTGPRIKKMLESKTQLRNAIILKEILDKPLSEREHLW